MNEKVKSWKQKFPFGIEELVKGLSNNTRLAIASLLLEKGEIHPNDISKELNLNKDIVIRQLKIMSNCGIIKRTKSKWHENKGVFDSHYMINKFYNNLIKTMINQCNTVMEKSMIKIYTYEELKNMKLLKELKNIKAVKCPECKKVFKDDIVFFEKHAIRNYGRCMTCEDKTRGPGMTIVDNFDRFGKLMKEEMEDEK